jgi:hypothetical protein
MTKATAPESPVPETLLRLRQMPINLVPTNGCNKSRRRRRVRQSRADQKAVHYVFSRVEMWRGGLGRPICFRPFRLPVSHCPDRAPFPHPAHRTGQALLTHPALGGNITFSPTESCRSAE